MSAKPPRRKSGRFRGIGTEERQAQRRRMLVAAGIEVFGTQGFHAATVREVCAEAKLTERYFYESFPNREALYVAVYEHLTTRLRDALVTALLPAPRDAGAMARAALRMLFQSMKDDPRLMRILFTDVFTVSDEVDRLSRRTTESYAELVRGMVESLYPKVRDSGFDVRLVAHGLVGAFMNTAMHWAYGGYAEPVDVVVRNCALLFEALGAYVERGTRAPRPAAGRTANAD